MIEGARVSRQFLAFNHRTLSLNLFPRTVPGASALAFSLLACAWALPRIPFGAPNVAQAPAVASAPKAVASAAVANPFGAVLVDLRSRARSAAAALARHAAPASKAEPFGSATLDLSVPAVPATPAARVAEIPPLPPRRSEEFASDAAPAADNAPPAPSVVQLGENAPEGLPVPPRRPDELSANQNPHELNQNAPPVRLSAREAARQRRNGRTVVAAAPPAADNRTFLEKLFGGAPQSQTASPALGYAPAEGGVTTAARSVMSMSSPTARYDQFTAVYDISAHTVYLPNGQRLEAHSGLGSMLDDPRSVTQKMRGATPPTVYALTPREQLFHGVQALRLTPLGGNVYGRAGLLAHTFMLGPNGDSNGCVSFRNYQAFLQAYQNGQIRRLAVVASLN